MQGYGPGFEYDGSGASGPRKSQDGNVVEQNRDIRYMHPPGNGGIDGEKWILTLHMQNMLLMLT